MKEESLQVLLAKGAFFKGEIRFKGTSHIAGFCKGSIKGKGSLVIESSAKVEADVEVDHLIVLGEFSGKATAYKSVLMEPPARFSGEVYSSSLTIKEGVVFEGSSKKISI